MSAGDPAGRGPASAAAPPGPTVRLNGAARRLPPGTTVAELLAQLSVATDRCAVEVNETIVPRSAHARHRLCEGDRIEIVGFVGGG